jgi:hypothetical protein
MKQKMVDEIKAKSAGYDRYILRISDYNNVNQPSHLWIDGEDTGEELPGVCGIDCTSNIIDAVEKIEKYIGKYILLIGCNRYQWGEDDGEIIAVDGEIIAVFDSPVNPDVSR